MPSLRDDDIAAQHGRGRAGELRRVQQCRLDHSRRFLNPLQQERCHVGSYARRRMAGSFFAEHCRRDFSGSGEAVAADVVRNVHRLVGARIRSPAAGERAVFTPGASEGRVERAV